MAQDNVVLHEVLLLCQMRTTRVDDVVYVNIVT
jgi:hypothetical protein